MKANELMIDDWVYNKNTDKPMQIYPMIFSQMFRVRPDATTEDYNIFPIPLTPEILEKNGFKTEDDIHFSIHGLSNMLELLMLEAPFGGYCFDIVRTEKTINKCNQRCYIDRYFASIYYVHQLQHALRLCGIEKEIEL